MGGGCPLRSGQYPLRDLFELLRGEIVWKLMIHDVAEQMLDVIYSPIQGMILRYYVHRASRTGDLVEHRRGDSDRQLRVQAFVYGGFRRHPHIFFVSKLHILIFRMLTHHELHIRSVESFVRVCDEFGHRSEPRGVIDRGVVR